MKLSVASTLIASIIVSVVYLSAELALGPDHWHLQIESASARPSRGIFGDGATSAASNNQLTDLALLNRSIIHIKENYVDPSRVNERKMVAAALLSVQEQLDEVLIRVSPADPAKSPETVVVRVGAASQSFDLTDVTNLWTLCFKLKDVFRFVVGELKTIPKPREVEYAAINGLLSTLDPHSVLLRPAEYREMKLSTDGNFGGLGIVIQLQDDALTIVRTIDKTPAEAAGLRAGDRLYQIGLDSTVNMSLDEAVGLLRGREGSLAEIWVERKGWTRPKRFLIRRAWIKVKSVHQRLLGKRVGIIKIDHFQHTTNDELRAAIKTLRRKARGRLKGIVLDLRGNPGGLLTQAVQVADTFITSGPIVTTVGYGDKMREPRMATRASTEANLPIAVLIDPSSASASEIVAGALKNHNRAVLIGQRSFGKGSVQVLYSNRDESALKLTIAQYLTPGDLSIQSVGITPDIETSAVLIKDDDIDVIMPEARGEDTLPSHLDKMRDHASKDAQPTYTLQYLQDPDLQERISKQPNKLLTDFEISLAQRFLLQAKTNSRDIILRDSASFIQSTAKRANTEVQRALSNRGIDWKVSESKGTGTPRGQVTVTTNLRQGVVNAGEALKITVKVRNDGDAAFERMYGLTQCDDAQFDDREFVFGRVEPGKQRSWSMSFPIDESTLERENVLRIAIRSEAGDGPVVTPIVFRINPVPAPAFVFAYHIDDSKDGNGDGLLQLGETAELVVRTRNVGVGDSRGFLGVLRNDADAEERSVFIELGRINQDPLKVDHEQTLRFRFSVKEFSKGVAKLLLTTYDPKLRWGTTNPLTLHLVNEAFRLDPKPISVRGRKDRFNVYAHPTDTTKVIGVASGVLRVRSGVSGWYRVPVDEDVFGWVRTSDVVAAPDGLGDVVDTRLSAPFSIEIKGDTLPLSVKSDHLTVVGSAHGKTPIRDVRVYANGKKIHYGSASTEESKRRLRFTARVPLEKETTRVTIVVRGSQEEVQRRMFVVRKDSEK